LGGVAAASYLRADAADSKTTGNLTFNDSICATFGTGNDLRLYHDATNSYIYNATGNLYIRNVTDALASIPNSYTYLYYCGVSKLYTVTNGICLGANCGFGTDWIATSDCRLKTNIQPISNALSTVTQLQGVCYNMCDDVCNENRIGLIAQDVIKVLPEIVSHSEPNEDDSKYGITDEKLGIKYDKITAILIESTKELYYKIIELNDKIIILENIINKC
jgi:hypothetical protein